MSWWMHLRQLGLPAAENDPVAAFLECVREESLVYPRPMPLCTLENKPFSMTTGAVEAAFATAREQGCTDDIERVTASNGEVYFYSIRYHARLLTGGFVLRLMIVSAAIPVTIVEPWML